MAHELWRARYDAHPIWANLEQLREALDEADFEDPAPEVADELDRQMMIVGFILARRATPNVVISISTLDALNSAVDTARSYLAQFAAGGGLSSLQQAGAQVGSLGDQARAWSVADGIDTGPARDLLVLSERRTQSKFDRTTNSLEALETRADEQASAIETTTSNMTAKSAEFEAAVDAQKTRLDAAIESINGTFTEGETARAEKFASSVAEQKAAFDRAALRLEDSAASTISSLEEKLVEATKLVEAVGTRGTATDYGNYAVKETRAAFGWSIAAVSAFVGSLAVFLTFLFVGRQNTHSVTWQTEVMRVGSSVALLVLGAYCGKESAGHRRVARLAKSKQLDLVALGPFVATLKPAEQESIRAAAARRLFTEPDKVDADAEALTQISDVLAALRRAGLIPEIPEKP